MTLPGGWFLEELLGDVEMKTTTTTHLSSSLVPSEIRSNCSASATAWALAHVPSGSRGGRMAGRR